MTLPSYLTIGGATVTLTRDNDGIIRLACDGCPHTDTTAWGDTDACALAQAHADMCRALPRLPDSATTRRRRMKRALAIALPFTALAVWWLRDSSHTTQIIATAVTICIATLITGWGGTT